MTDEENEAQPFQVNCSRSRSSSVTEPGCAHRWADMPVLCIMGAESLYGGSQVDGRECVCCVRDSGQKQAFTVIYKTFLLLPESLRQFFNPALKLKVLP